MQAHWNHGISAALLGVLILLPAPPASAQSHDDFAYWDANGNGDLTCTEAGPASPAGGRDDGLRLPAYKDNRDGTGIIYEWLERSRSSDTDDDGIGCDSASNPNGYIPNVQVQPPVETQGCPADAETWRGLKVCDERPRDGYARDAFGTGYSSLEDEIIAALPPTMKANGQVYTPYSCLAFDITATGTAATDIEHIVALAETHDSGIADERRRDIASDLDNLTIADPTVNRSQKSDRDAADWMPGPTRRVVRGAGDPSQDGIRVERRSCRAGRARGAPCGRRSAVELCRWHAGAGAAADWTVAARSGPAGWRRAAAVSVDEWLISEVRG